MSSKITNIILIILLIANILVNAIRILENRRNIIEITRISQEIEELTNKVLEN